MTALDELKKYDGEWVKYFTDIDEPAGDNGGELIIIDKDGQTFPAIKTLVLNGNSLVPGYLRLDLEKTEIHSDLTGTYIFVEKGGYKKILEKLD